MNSCCKCDTTLATQITLSFSLSTGADLKISWRTQIMNFTSWLKRKVIRNHLKGENNSSIYMHMTNIRIYLKGETTLRSICYDKKHNRCSVPFVITYTMSLGKLQMHVWDSSILISYALTWHKMMITQTKPV